MLENDFKKKCITHGWDILDTPTHIHIYPEDNIFGEVCEILGISGTEPTTHISLLIAGKVEHLPKSEFPYSEGDDYWTVENLDEDYDDNTGCYSNGIIAIQSCWDDQSEEMHSEDKEYFDTLEDVLKHAQYQYNFIKVSCFDSEMPDIKSGDYFVATDDDCGKFQKSY